MDVSVLIRARQRRAELIRRLSLLGVGTVVCGFGSWFVGFDTWHSVAFALVIAAIWLGWILIPPFDASAWPEIRSDSSDGARSDVARLSWTLLIHRNEVRESVAERVIGQAARRLLKHGLDLDEPDHADGIRDLIGVNAYSILRAAEDAPMSFPGLVACVNALERLDATPASRKEAS